ncbi:MAG TPA: hypothetical protein VN436_14790 [Holophaga sp.]|nr:hypothetical protein [Holophaga sp.]
MQHPEIEEGGDLPFVPPGNPAARRRHGADPLAVSHVIDAHQVQGVGKGVDDVT